MKPITTYVFLLAVTFAAVAAASRYAPDLTLPLLIGGAMILVSLTGSASFYPARMATDSYPPTIHLVPIGIIVDAATIAVGRSIGYKTALTVLLVGLLLQFSITGKIAKEFDNATQNNDEKY